MKIRVGHFFPGGAVESNENELRIVYIKSNEEKTADRERSAGKWYTVDKPISQTGIIGPTPPLDIQSNGVEYSPPVR